MKRGVYNILCAKNGSNGREEFTRTIYGYLFTIDNVEFGCANSWIDDDGKFCSYGGWVVTELSTGYRAVPELVAKKADVESVTLKYLPSIKKAISDNFVRLSAARPK